MEPIPNKLDCCVQQHSTPKTTHLCALLVLVEDRTHGLAVFCGLCIEDLDPQCDLQVTN